MVTSTNYYVPHVEVFDLNATVHILRLEHQHCTILGANALRVVGRRKQNTQSIESRKYCAT